MTTQSGYGNVYLDPQMRGCGWSFSTSPTAITYPFASGDLAASEISISTFIESAWTEIEKDVFRMALNNYSSVCNLQFVESTAQTTDLKWWKAPESAMGAGSLGLHEVPNAAYASIYGYFNVDDPSRASLNKGSYGYISIIHELGHVMGLARPHDGGTETNATAFPDVTADTSLDTKEMNQGIWTTMSYNDGWKDHKSEFYEYGWQGTLMTLDIAALQKRYGANMTTATGNNVYQLPSVNDVSNELYGAAGNDALNGGAGLDTFAFNTALSATANKDTFADFNVTDDTIQLENTTFTKLSALTTLAASYFCSNASGTAADFVVV